MLKKFAIGLAAEQVFLLCPRNILIDRVESRVLHGLCLLSTY